ncbi:Asp23/Gls24 family envelope stress response protein [Jatrophihabitans fulvus]
MSRPRPLLDPEDRGSLFVANRVIEKVAAQAAGEVERTAPLDPKLAERFPGRNVGRARASAVVSGRFVQLRLELGVQYPNPVVPVTREVRRHVTEVVDRLCDVDVRDVDIEVTRLRRAQPAASGPVR